MASRFNYYRRYLSFSDAAKFYFYVKGKKDKEMQLSFLRNPVLLRANPCDREMFSQIFLQKQYDLYYPFTPANILDLGANIGLGALYFANRFPEANIISLEPETSNYTVAKKNLAGYPKVKLLQGAIWYQEGKIDVIDHGHGEAAFMVSDGTVNIQGKVIDTIPAYTIAQLAGMLGAETIDLVKMDVEGAEKEIFQHDVSGWLPRTKMLIVETHDRYKPGSSQALFAVMAHQDFSMEISGENLVFYNNKLVTFNPFEHH